MIELWFQTAKWLVEVRIDATTFWLILQAVGLASVYLLNNILR